MSNKLTKLLLAHRKAGTTVDALPAELVPADLKSAYAIQDETIVALGKVGAWKVAPFPETGEPACSPLLASAIHPDGVRLRHSDLPGLAIEVEVAVKLSRDLRGTASEDEVRAAIGSVHPALELLSSRFADRRSVPQLAAFADLQSNGAIVLGAPVSFATLPEFGNQAMTLSLDGRHGASTESGPTTSNMLSALTWLVRHSAARNTPLTAGMVVITGARLGPVVFQGTHAEAQAPGLGSVKASFTER
ncbi:2-keto-4-pentenoate hydratase [Devosia rhizoryzae]|uniref:Fumarylacetoacetate hydrolase family protein n=1 Tax=Devosia rhizoryzae TaxID=2774137 RepID=A0ABX7C233_9HYPH|nr:fumarylacetoacetate hydrolase family protein [Devosia rhizoryzae]QQR38299.1 fumarylacetoacetate hydrolase family protein [Devosia rhizoryzae]